MVFYVEAQTKEHVVPDVHLNFGVLSWVNGHYVVFDDGHGTSGCRVDKVTMNLEHGSFADEPFGQRLLRQLFGCLYFFVPVARVTRYVVLVTELGRVRVFGAEPVHRVLEIGREPRVDLKGRADPLEGMLLSALLLDLSKSLFERAAERVEQVDERVIHFVCGVLLGTECVIGALVDVEAFEGGRQVIALILYGDHVQVHEVAFHFAFSRRWIPAAERELLEACGLLGFRSV